MYRVVNFLVAQVYGTAPRAPVHCRKFERDTCLLQNISFQQHSLYLWVWWRTHERKSDHAYSKNLQGNSLRETYVDLWHIHYFNETMPMETRSDHGDSSTGACMATGLQGTDDPVGLPNVCLIYLLFSSRRISDQHKKWVMSARFWSQSAVSFGSCFCMLAANVDLCSFSGVKRRCWSLTCVWNLA